MVATTKPLHRYCAGELMTPAVVMIPQEMSLQGAAKLLSRAQVNGGPVVDDQGKCVGVLSASDFLHWAEKGGKIDRTRNETRCSSWQILEETPEDAETRVCDIMNHDPVTVSASVSIGELSRMMMNAHIHRVIVVDENQKPTGVVSCTDILAALAHVELIDEELL